MTRGQVAQSSTAYIGLLLSLVAAAATNLAIVLGETAAHQFKIEVTCLKIKEYAPEYRDPSRIPRPPRPRF